MTKIITQGLESNIKMTFSLLDKFIEVCPTDIWAKKFGGWPVWQQVYHALAAVDFFIKDLDEPSETALFGEEEANLSVSAKVTVDKAELKTLSAKMQRRISEYAASLTDAALTQNNAGLSARMNMPTTHASTLSLIAAHTLYHLGSCDAALREHGLSGVF